MVATARTAGMERGLGSLSDAIFECGEIGFLCIQVAVQILL